VTNIQQQFSYGLYAPLTPSGTLFVNGIKVSTYASLQKGNPSVWEHRFDIFGSFSQQFIVHTLASPIRIICMGGIFPDICSTASIDPSNGHPPYVDLVLWLVNIFDERNAMIQFMLMTLYMLILVPLFAIEKLVGAQNVPYQLFIFIMGAIALHKQSKKTLLVSREAAKVKSS
jgi:hypothetical protein